MKQKHAVDGRGKDFLTDAEMSRFLQAARSGATESETTP